MTELLQSNTAFSHAAHPRWVLGHPTSMRIAVLVSYESISSVYALAKLTLILLTVSSLLDVSRHLLPSQLLLLISRYP